MLTALNEPKSCKSFWRLRTSQKLSGYFTNFEQSEKLSNYFAVNSWAWLPFRYLIKLFLYWGGNFEMHFLREQLFFEFLFIRYGGFLNVCSFCFKKVLVTDQFNIRLQFWLNLVLDILFIFLILYLGCIADIPIFLQFYFFYPK